MSIIVSTLIIPATVGAVAARIRLFPDPTAAMRALHQLTATICFPALVISALCAEGRAWPTHLAGALAVPIALAAALLFTRSATSVLAVTFGNTAYLGLPVVAALIGPSIGPRAALFVSETVVFSLLVGMPIAARAGGVQGATGVLRHPLFWAPWLGLALRAAQPTWGLALTPLGQSAAPIAALLLGHYLYDNARALRPPWALLGLRLFVVPALQLAVGAAMSAAGWLQREEQLALVLLAATPSGLAGWSVATGWGSKADDLGDAVVVGTLLCPFTIGAWWLSSAWW